MTLSRDRDADTCSSDDFDQLSSTLPPIPLPKLPIEGCLAARVADDFTQWQLNRFNRSGNLRLCSVISTAFRLTSAHLSFLVGVYIPFLIFLVLTVHRRWILLFVPTNAIGSLFATSAVFSIISGEKFWSRARYILSRQGIVAFVVQMTTSFIIYVTMKSAIDRASTITGQFLLLVLVSHVTYFHSCFVFEGLSLSFVDVCSFTVQLLCSAIPIVQSIAISVVALALHLLAPFTVGVTVWMAYVMRGLVFLAVCGSGTTIAAMPEL
jgi:hypothetical protein